MGWHAAFTVSIVYDSGTVIYISIWKSPDIKFPSTFPFRDETNQIGQAYILPELDPLILLNGKVSLSHVNAESPVEGAFDLKDENGNHFKGRFQSRVGKSIYHVRMIIEIKSGNQLVSTFCS